MRLARIRRLGHAGRRIRSLNGWTWTASGASLLLVAPLLVVLFGAAGPANDLWPHLVDTVLAGYVVNTVGIAFGVAAGTAVLGVGTAWLIAMCDFPGRSMFAWALILPLALPGYVAAFVYGDLLEFAGPVQTALRDGFGWVKDDYWFPAVRSPLGAIAVLSLVLYPYVYLLVQTAFATQSAHADRDRPAARAGSAHDLSDPGHSPGPAGAGRWLRARSHGDAERHRGGRIVRHRNLHYRHLPSLVRIRGCRCSRAAGDSAAAGRACRPLGGAAASANHPVPSRERPQSAGEPVCTARPPLGPGHRLLCPSGWPGVRIAGRRSDLVACSRRCPGRPGICRNSLQYPRPGAWRHRADGGYRGARRVRSPP